MASKKISELTAITPLLTDLVPLDRPTTGAGAPVTGQATLADIQALIDTGGGGGGGNEYWESTVAGKIFATGSLVAVTGSLWAQFLSASNGLEITGSFTHGIDVTASGQYSHAQGDGTTASEYASHAEGAGTTASGDYSHAEGAGTLASGDASHAEGDVTTASGIASHAEGASGGGGSLIASGYASHAEGYNTIASGQYSHAEGDYTTAAGEASHSEGDYAIASGSYSHAEGTYTIADGLSSHAEGWGSATHLRGFTVVYVDSDGVDPANGIFQLDSVYGDITTDIQNASNITSRMVTDGDIAGGFIGDRRVYDFVGTNFESPSTWITCSNSYGMNPQALFPYTGSIIASLAPLEWQLSTFTTPPDQAITGTISHAEGIESISIGSGSHAEGFRTLAIGVSKDLTFYNSPGDATWGAHAEGFGTIAYGNASHAEGYNTTASGEASHAEGDSTTASGEGSHAEGNGTTASGNYSHAEGSVTKTIGSYSHASGFKTVASGTYQTVIGKGNLLGNDFSLFVIGDGQPFIGEPGQDNISRSDIVRVNLGASPGSGSFEVTGSLSVTVGMTGSLSYTPGNGAYWADPDPTNIKDALDRIASLLYTLNSNTPIP